jgi:hypothetical protein
MNDREWLRSRRPSPPPKLFDRLEAAVTPLTEDLSISRSEILASAATALLVPLVGPDAPEVSRNREVAIDLLAADALLTYAIEAATEKGDAFAREIDRVIARLASLAPAGKA